MVNNNNNQDRNSGKFTEGSDAARKAGQKGGKQGRTDNAGSGIDSNNNQKGSR